MALWKLRTKTLRIGTLPAVMGILNVTPDSFSDGGKHFSIRDALDAGLRMEDDGAAIIDIGGESTRPYSTPVTEEEELSRTIPVIEGLAGRVSIPISIDTTKGRVAQAALEAGAEIINDISGLEKYPAMSEIARRTGAGVCVMHMQGTPQTMQDDPRYDDVVEDILRYLRSRLEACLAFGIDRDRICLDPGIGFGKTHEQNRELLRHAHRFLELDTPILVGHSRKGFIAHVLGSKECDRTAGTIGVSIALAKAGMHILRVHDVRETVDALRLFEFAGGFE